MTESEFLELFSDAEVEFSEIDKYCARYENEELNIWVSGFLEYRDLMTKKETVQSIYDLEGFRFGAIKDT